MTRHFTPLGPLVDNRNKTSVPPPTEECPSCIPVPGQPVNSPTPVATNTPPPTHTPAPTNTPAPTDDPYAVPTKEVRG